MVPRGLKELSGLGGTEKGHGLLGWLQAGGPGPSLCWNSSWAGGGVEWSMETGPSQVTEPGTAPDR